MASLLPAESCNTPLASNPTSLESSSFLEPPVESTDYNFTVAICAIVKDGEAYFEEWLDYHLEGMKFQNIYLYDNSDDNELKRWYENTRNHPVYSKVEVIHHPGNSYIEDEDAYVQSIIVSDCVQRFGKDEDGPQHDYIALFDLDEFMVPQQYPNAYNEIRAIVKDYLVPYGGALTVNWVLMGTANHTLYSPIPVTRRFQYRQEETHYIIKSIVKSTDFRGMRNPHAVSLRKGVKVRTLKYPGCIHNDPSSKKGASDHDRPSDVLLMYHYRYTSTKEYLWKRCTRGNLSVKYIWCTKKGTLREDTPSHIKPIPGDVYDDKAWKLLTSRVPKYRMYNDWEDYT